jgi:hypothetical protein
MTLPNPPNDLQLGERVEDTRTRERGTVVPSSVVPNSVAVRWDSGMQTSPTHTTIRIFDKSGFYTEYK